MRIETAREEQSIVSRAKQYAIEKHGDQMYGKGKPYSWHLGKVAELAAILGYSEQVQAAGWLHDTVEDTNTTLDEIRERFGNGIALMVEGVTYTEEDKQAGVNKINKAKQNVGSQALKNCDSLVNLSASVIYGSPAGKDPWYEIVERYSEYVSRIREDLPTPEAVDAWLDSLVA